MIRMHLTAQRWSFPKCEKVALHTKENASIAIGKSSLVVVLSVPGSR